MTCDDCLSSVNIIRIPLENILLPRNVPAGLSPWTLFAIANHLRNSGGDVLEPIKVQRLVGTDLWKLKDGRHRFVGSVLAGVLDIIATEEQPETRVTEKAVGS